MFSCFCCLLLTFFSNFILKNNFRNTIIVSNGLDPDQDKSSGSKPGADPGFLERGFLMYKWRFTGEPMMVLFRS